MFFCAKMLKLLNFTPNKCIPKGICFHLKSLIVMEKLWSSAQLSRSQSHFTNVRSQFCSIQNKLLVQANEFQNKLILVFNAITFKFFLKWGIIGNGWITLSCQYCILLFIVIKKTPMWHCVINKPGTFFLVCLKVYFEKEEIRAVQDPPLYLFVCSKNPKEKITNNFFLLAYLIQKDFFVF